MEAPADRLLDYLKGRLERPALAYARPPIPVPGGYDTLIYGCELQGAPPEFSGELILRVFRDSGGSHRAAAEAAIQNGIAATGYPAPAVLEVCTDDGAVGGAFTIMPRVRGTTLLAAIGPSPMLLRAGPLLARAHARLHALDAKAFESVLHEAGIPVPVVGSGAWLESLTAVIDSNQLEGMRAGLDWLVAHRPAEPAQPAILHLDFHPGNVLIEGGAVSGVIDWGGVSVGDAAADVAATRMILTMGPLDVPGWARPVIDGLRSFIGWRYLATYRRERALPAASLHYYDAAKCFSTMTHAGAIRAAKARGESTRETYAWSGEREVRRITARFKKVTGVALQLPA